MRAHGVVKGLNIGEEICLSGTAGVVATQMNQFTFQAAEEVFGHCVVVRVTLTGHALADSQGSQPVTEFFVPFPFHYNECFSVHQFGKGGIAERRLRR